MPLDAVKTAENSKERSTDDLLRGLKVARPSVKERTTDPKAPKESKFKLAFGFKDIGEVGKTNFEILSELYTLGERKSRLGTLLMPMFFETKGNQATAVIITALTYAEKLNKHSDAEWRAMIDNRDVEKCDYRTFDLMDRVATTLICNAIEIYADGGRGYNELMDLSPNGAWARLLPQNKNEALFVAQLICDGGINKYGLSCADLGKNLLNDITDEFGLATPSEVREQIAELDKGTEVE